MFKHDFDSRGTLRFGQRVLVRVAQPVREESIALLQSGHRGDQQSADQHYFSLERVDPVRAIVVVKQHFDPDIRCCWVFPAGTDPTAQLQRNRRARRGDHRSNPRYHTFV